MTPFEKLKLPANFEVVTAAEFLAALQPSQNIQRIGPSKIIALQHHVVLTASYSKSVSFSNFVHAGHFHL